MKAFILHIILLFISIQYSFAQKILNDKVMAEKINSGLDLMYNFKFDEADKFFLEVKKKYPEHPAYYFLSASNEYWRIMANNSFKERSAIYNEKLKQASLYSQKLYIKNKKDPEAIFFQLATHSAIAYYHNIKEDYFKTMAEAKETYAYMKEGFELTDQYPEFNFTTGLYNYYSVRYPETRPIVKPFMLFFTEGSIQKGLNQLEYASLNGVFTKTEALNFLVNVYLKYENKPGTALKFSNKLIEKYPENVSFQARHAEALVLSGHYKEAESYARELRKTENAYFDMAGCIFWGMIHEKGNKNLEKAKAYYLHAIKLSEKVSNPSTDYISFAYLGMGRIYNTTGNKPKALEYYKKAAKNAQYIAVKKEADDFLKKYDSE